MESAAPKKVFYYSVDGSTLGGFLDTPIKGDIPSQASATLPAVGGRAHHRTGAFDHEHLVSCSSARTHVSGREHPEESDKHPLGGPWSVLVTSVVEDLNILEVLTARRVVAQLTLRYEVGMEYPRISLAGTRFEDLRIAGFEALPTYNPALLDLQKAAGVRSTDLKYPIFQQTGEVQAVTLLGGINRQLPNGPDQWLIDRFGWMQPTAKRNDGRILCSVVDAVATDIPGNHFGHVVEVPDFGRIFLGELYVTPRSVELTMIRAELGCNTTGSVSAASSRGTGVLVPP